MTLRRFGVSLEDELLEQLDQYVLENGYANRSQAIRFLIEKNLPAPAAASRIRLAGTVVLLFDQAKREIPAKITLIQQEFKEVILSSSQYYLNRSCCLHTVTIMGEAHRLTELADKLIAIKGLKHGKLVMSRAD